MSNMSYCRFHNTNLDVQDCIDAMRGLIGLAEDIEWLKSCDYENVSDDLKVEQEMFNTHCLSSSEANAASRMFQEILDYMLELDVINGYSKDTLDELIDGISGQR